MALDRISVVIPPVGSWREQGRWYRWAEQTGYDVAYTYDHLTHATAPGMWLSEAFTTLTAAAGTTERIRLGTLVASAVFRTPVTLARIAMTVQDISGARLVLGLGAGAPTCALADHGVRERPRDMSARFADVVRGYTAVLDGATEWQGATLSFRGLETTSAPDGTLRPELLLAAHGPRALALAAEFADTWNTYGGPGSTTLDPDDYWALLARQAQGFDRACEDAGRAPGAVRRSLLLGFGQVRPTTSVDDYLAAAERAEALGFDELVVYAPDSPAGMDSDPVVHERALARLR
ncbi:LLM class flavin-dependent oxidoreductase [Microbacterium sp. NEAU-LLC]|uniref:LLM class flavin-dependent oxidoreductase n=1 Tax=Microbacterium helvum TaxID=2773713 RepID=A0ABR8NRQ9_9MICO|nr:LLM class flavin-dependent oxidoreductase [Microbacterium helvum]MBD3943305.1 LLM class flavin-dependent oxidoreductase [Microbacterium helvum]